jgi:hypothetical protein
VTLSPRHAKFRQAVRGFYAWVAALLLALVAPLAAQVLVDADGWWVRLAGVLVGTAAWVPLVLVIAAIIRAGDEYHRRLHLTAAAIAFAASLLVISGLSWLVEADFLRMPPLQVLWVAFGLVWVASTLAVKRHFERQA